MSSIDIRSLRLSDCDKIGPMLREVWLDAYHGIQTDQELLAQSHKVHRSEQIAKEIENEYIHSVVAVSDGRIIGHARSDLNNGIVELSQGYQIMRRGTEVQTEGRDVFEYKIRKLR